MGPGRRAETPRAPDLSVSIGRLRLSNPVMAASGTFGGGYPAVVDCSRLGAVVLKTVTLKPRSGNPPPRIWETPGGILNSIGLENKGLRAFLKGDLPAARKMGTRIVVSISGETVEEYAVLARAIDRAGGVDAIELNISCPNVSKGLDFGTDPKLSGSAVRAAKKATRLPVIAKLTPNVTNIVPIARSVVENGADAVSLVNTLKGMAVDWRRQRPRLGGITGGLSGPAIKPVALRMVWEVASAVRVPIVGIGGIASAED
ncbi:MAG: dihydroorotate dehydrogenase B catalytic subunit, partial [Planctomycetes bacterium RBG_16_59_8]